MLVLRRYELRSDKAVNGEFWHNSKLICFSVEKPWKNNQRRISCIPDGEYEMVFLPNGSKTFQYPCFLLKSVPNRSGIMIHRANRESQLLGCIAPNLELYYKGGFYTLSHRATRPVQVQIDRLDGEGGDSTTALDIIVELHRRFNFKKIRITSGHKPFIDPKYGNKSA